MTEAKASDDEIQVNGQTDVEEDDSNLNNKKENQRSLLQMEEADLGRRIAAAFVDCCVALLLFLVLGWIGSMRWMSFILISHLFWIVPIVYILTRDTYVEKKPLSLGKRLAKIDVICETTEKPPDLIGSIQRNLLFVFPPLCLCLAGLEIYLLIKSPSQKRFGDHFGKTIVIKKSIID